MADRCEDCAAAARFIASAMAQGATHVVDRPSYTAALFDRALTREEIEAQWNLLRGQERDG